MNTFQRTTRVLDELREARQSETALPPLPVTGEASLSEFVAALDARDEQTYPITAR